MPKAPKPSNHQRSAAAVRRAISRAEAILPGWPAPPGEIDPRWQAIIRVGEFMESHPEPVWQFILRWGKHPQDDLRAAIATCLLEHFLETDFDKKFPRVQVAVLKSPRFVRTLEMCWWFGEAKLPGSAPRLNRLKSLLRRQRAAKTAARKAKR